MGLPRVVYPDGGQVTRFFGWGSIAFLGVFLLNDYLTYWQGWPGAIGPEGEASDYRSWLQAAFYAAAALVAVLYLGLEPDRPLRKERARVIALNSFLIRAVFWSVLLIGILDFAIALLRGEGLLASLVGEDFASQLMRKDFRGAYVHMSLIGVSVVIAALTRSIAVTWLVLLIVVSELLLVLSRFVFSYEQDYMADLVRFWFAPSFLVGCAYALRHEAHVRIDVIYTRMTPRGQSLINALGAVLLGMPLCWLILVVGTSGKTGIMNSALRIFEIEGLGNGLYVLYLMTVLLGVFAVTMLIEFTGALFGAVADYRGEPVGEGP